MFKLLCVRFEDELVPWSRNVWALRSQIFHLRIDLMCHASHSNSISRLGNAFQSYIARHARLKKAFVVCTITFVRNRRECVCSECTIDHMLKAYVGGHVLLNIIESTCQIPIYGISLCSTHLWLQFKPSWAPVGRYLLSKL